MGLFTKKEKNKTNEIKYAYTKEELEILENFIKDNYGDFDLVLHEKVSSGIHLDIAIVPPTEKHNYYKLVTMGMGSYLMNVPESLKSYNLERAELVLFLPSTWDINSAKEEDYWPIRYLKVLARLPIENHSWLGFGHTVSANNENTTYASNTNFCSIMLLTALNNQNSKLNLNLKNRGKINFYQLYPLYKEELEYKMNHDSIALLNLINDKDLSPVLNIKRKNYGLEDKKVVKEIKKTNTRKTTTKSSSKKKDDPKKKVKNESLKTKATKKAVKKVATNKAKKAVKKAVKNNTKKKR